jgi:hypothetical protein
LITGVPILYKAVVSAGWFWSARPGNVITVPKTYSLLRVGVHYLSQWNCFC